MGMRPACGGCSLAVHININCKFRDKLPNNCKPTSKIFLKNKKDVQGGHKAGPMTSLQAPGILGQRLQQNDKKERKNCNFFGRTQKITTFACLFGEKR